MGAWLKMHVALVSQIANAILNHQQGKVEAP